MVEADLSNILIVLVLAGFALALVMRNARKTALASEMMQARHMALVQLIINLRKKVAREAPDNDRAQAYLVSAAMHLIYPKGAAGPMRIIGPGELMRRYDDGFTEAAKVQAVLDGLDFKDPDSFESDFDEEQKALLDKIIAVSKQVAAACPADEEAHRLLIEASMKLVFPHNYGGAYRVVGPGDVLVRYRDGMTDAEKAEAIADSASRKS